MRKTVRIIVTILFFICSGTSAYFACKVYQAEKENKESADVYDVIATQASSREEKDSAEDPEYPDVDMAYLRSQNKDAAGWIFSPGTVIDYPVVQGNDNDYYLEHLFDGSVNANGCIFIDCGNREPFKDDNTIIYGHHMKSGAMFASLTQYDLPEYYREHPYLYFINGDGVYKIELFAGYSAAVEDDFHRFNFTDESDFSSWLSYVQSRSDFKAQCQVNSDDKIVTLVTCAYVFEDARYVLHGRVLKIA